MRLAQGRQALITDVASVEDQVAQTAEVRRASEGSRLTDT
jgi:hypothetical protein